MATFTPTGETLEQTLNQEALIREAKRARHLRRRNRASFALAIFMIAVLTFLGVRQLLASTTAVASSHSGQASTVKCSHVRVRFLSADAIPGASVSAGILVKTTVSATTACRLEGYPSVHLTLGNGSGISAVGTRSGIFGGLAPSRTVNAPLHNFEVNGHPKAMSFTIAWISGNGGGGCPRIAGVRFTMPDSLQSLAFHSIYEIGTGPISFLGIDCGHVSVTPAVTGTTGKYGW